jgi:hypothetical protein
MREWNPNWIDPDSGQPYRTLGEQRWREGVTAVDGQMIAVTGVAHHKTGPFDIVHSQNLEHIDGQDWELFSVSHKGNVDGRDLYWGSFIEGIGAFHNMVDKAQCRPLTDAEREQWSGQRMQMVGSHSGKVSYEFAMPEITTNALP